jgi:hypothetical protein
MDLTIGIMEHPWKLAVTECAGSNLLEEKRL